MNKIQLFRPSLRGKFLHRPNRFTIIARTESGEIRAHCPNPGRMRELLVPGRECFFEHHAEKNRKTAYSLAAVNYNGTIVPLFSAGANRIARELILPGLFPEAYEIRPEFTFGRSRFDFLIRSPGCETLVEVKSCSLVEEGIAMFPDAPTIRGTRHVRELASIAAAGTYAALVLFVIANPSARKLVPGIHTDPAFSAAVLESRGIVEFRAASIDCSVRGEAVLAKPEIPVDTGPCTAAKEDSGVYLLSVRLDYPRTLEIGALGKLKFEKGTYVYTGSARKNLEQRTARHLRRRKRLHWHIDYLVKEADYLEVFPVRSTKTDLECRLARDVAQIAESSITGFGSSDCQCPSHLYRLDAEGEKSLLPLLLHYRHSLALEKENDEH
ncbi:DNA/RNA nuclease SfsA [Marispirochaeta aestuarii]|uniref:DNA/RNA nuclease SfsA n=1 Tax=Marispirochaeta aestuarii TaxID=1963862 RepID=UPI0029C7ADF1|nr:DNA/RNA nuclease SfsA [Marispirochaeta aestuarii]